MWQECRDLGLGASFVLSDIFLPGTGISDLIIYICLLSTLSSLRCSPLNFNLFRNVQYLHCKSSVLPVCLCERAIDCECTRLFYTGARRARTNFALHYHSSPVHATAAVTSEILFFSMCLNFGRVQGCMPSSPFRGVYMPLAILYLLTIPVLPVASCP